ncbi:MFS transporter [Phytomonospora sp. NPDC050363]|uniref:MFS transporter n=1 Tax=Phytomonospora sp. NPDC050363 TaxID=3155642 RepID=UPI0033C87164
MTRRDRVTITMVFAVHGMVGASFLTRVPWLADRLELGHGELGLALICPAIGAFLTMPMASGIVHRLGGRSATRLLILLWTMALAVPALMPSLPALCVALLLYGAAAGTSDVAMNAQGVLIERGLGRSIMSSLHGFWSVGALVGAGIGAAITYAEVDARVHLGVMAALMIVVGLYFCGRLPEARTRPEDAKPPRFVLPGKAIIGVGIVGFCAAFIEGAAHDWTTVFVANVTESSQGTAALAFSFFAATMALARIVGDMVVQRIGPVWTVRGSGILAIAGTLVVSVSRDPVPAIAGFVLIGLGVAVIIPLAISAAGRASTVPSQAIAGVVTIMYPAGLVSPGAMGGVAEVTSLPWSFVMLGGVAVVMLVLAGAVRERGAATTSADAETLAKA